MTTHLVAGTESPSGLRTAGIRARLALEAGKMVSWEWNIETDSVSADHGFFDLFGLKPQSMSASQVFGAMHPDDVALVQAEVDAALTDDCDYVTEFRVLLPDGTYRWIGARGAVTARCPAGQPLRMLGVNWNKTQQKLQEERLSMMADEMNHRVENAFAIMGALIQIGARSDDGKDEYAERLRGQVQALASAHRLSVEAIRRPDDEAVLIAVADIIQAALAAWSSEDTDQVTIAIRTDAHLASRQSGALAMLTYELATNAVKYGALSSPEGRLTVVLDQGDNGGVVLRWTERAPDMPDDADQPKAGRGFGSILIQHCEKMLRGSVIRTMTPTGLRVEAYFPVVQDADEVARAAARDMVCPASKNDDPQKRAG